MAQPPPLPWWARTQPERVILLTLAVVVCGAVAFFMLDRTGLFAWACGWKCVTGWPCAGCGGTRALRLLMSGDVMSALRLNPGFVAGGGLLLAGGFYASIVMLFRLPPWRPAWLTGRVWRWSLALAIVANWAYVVWSGRA